MLLNGVALLGGTPSPKVLATLPKEESLPLADRQVLHRLPQANIHRKGGYVGQKTAGSARYFCNVLDESPRIYVSALALGMAGGASASHLLNDYVCVWSAAPEILSGGFLQSFAQLCCSAFQTDSGYSAERLIQLWLWLLEVPAPSPGCSIHLHCDNALASPIFRPLALNSLEAPHVPLRFLFERLSLEDVLLLCRLVLLERRILLRSSSSFVLTACCEALARVLFFPLQWQHFFTPAATQQYLVDRGPWLLGLRRDVLELGGAALTAVPLADGQVCSIFDLDVGEVEVESSITRLPELPASIRQNLRAGLSRLMANKATKVEKAFALQEDVTFDQEVQQIFFRSLSPFFTKLRGHLGPNDFDAHGYVHSQALEAQPFCRALVETAAFGNLLVQMSRRSADRLAFEEALVKQSSDMDKDDKVSETGGASPDMPSIRSEGRDKDAQECSISESDVFRSVKSFQSCASTDSSTISSGTSRAVLCAGKAAGLELHLYPFSIFSQPPASPPRVLAAWTNPGSPQKVKKLVQRGAEGTVNCLVEMMKSQTTSRQRPQWLQVLGSKLSECDRSDASQWLPVFSGLLTPELMMARENSRESSDSGRSHLRIQNLKPECFATPGIRRAESHSSYPSNEDTDCEIEEAHFEDAEASPTILNSFKKCLKTPRHPGLLAAHLLRRAFLCLYVTQSEQKVVKDQSKSRKSSKHVRISHAVTTNFEEEDFLSPAGQRRKTLRSMTTSNLSISPTRSFASPPSPSPERGGKLHRRSDPTLLSSQTRLSPRRKTSKAAQLEKIKAETPQAVTDLCTAFCELQLCNPAELEHEDRQAFWLNVLNASTLAWVCATEPQKLQSNLFPMHAMEVFCRQRAEFVWLGFLQKNSVNIGGHIFSLMDVEHNILRAQSKGPKFGWIFQGQKGFKCEAKSRMALEHAAPEVSFGIFYPLRFGCPRLQLYYPQVVRDQLLLNCAQHLLESVTVEPKKRRVTLPPLLKYYANDFGGSNGALIHFVQSTLEAAPSLLEEFAFDGRPLSESENLLAQEAPQKAAMIEQLRKDGDFSQVAVSFSDFDWRLHLGNQIAGCLELEDLLEVALEKKMKVAPPPGRPPAAQPADLRQRRFVQIDADAEPGHRG